MNMKNVYPKGWSTSYIDILIDKYDQYKRYYHNTDHVYRCIGLIEDGFLKPKNPKLKILNSLPMPPRIIDPVPFQRRLPFRNTL